MQSVTDDDYSCVVTLSCYSVPDYSVTFLHLLGDEAVRTNKDKAAVRGIPSISNHHWLCIIHVVYSLYHDRMFLLVQRHNALREKRTSSKAHDLSNDTTSTALD